MTRDPKSRAPWWMRAANAALAKLVWLVTVEPAGPDCQICGKRLVFVTNPGDPAGIWAHKDNTNHAPLVRWVDIR